MYVNQFLHLPVSHLKHSKVYSNKSSLFEMYRLGFCYLVMARKMHNSNLNRKLVKLLQFHAQVSQFNISYLEEHMLFCQVSIISHWNCTYQIHLFLC